MSETQFDKNFRFFCDNPSLDNQAFCAEHMSQANARTIQTLNDLGSRIDWTSQGYHVAEGILRRAMKPADIRKFYQYCPSLEGLLPAWLESVDMMIRWLQACFLVYNHEHRNSTKNFPAEILQNAFPEIADIDRNRYFHAFWSTYDSIRAYGFDRSQPWERNVPDILNQLGKKILTHLETDSSWFPMEYHGKNYCFT